MRNPSTRPPYEVALIFTRDPDETPQKDARALSKAIHLGHSGALYGWMIGSATASVVQEAA